MAAGFWKHLWQGSLASCTRSPSPTSEALLPALVSLSLEAGCSPLLPSPIHKEFSIMERRGSQTLRPEGEHNLPDSLQKWLSPITLPPPVGFSPSTHQGPHLCGYHFLKLCQ